MILSNDTIMQPPYDITHRILELVAGISERLGEINANYLDKPSPTLRKQNKIRTIHSSLGIEGNTLSEDQVSALIDNKRVIGPEKDILEVVNAIEVYDNLKNYSPFSSRSFLSAHKTLMKGLLKDAGHYRKKGVGIVKAGNVEHLAPPYHNVPFLMKDLFSYLKRSPELPLIKSCVFHYEVEFIHPFADGNGRMGRLWQTVLLMNAHPVFEFLPFETLIGQTQQEYYTALSKSDKCGKSTVFIEYMLETIDRSLASLLDFTGRTLKAEDRIPYFLEQKVGNFSRKDYMKMFKDISSATASRDLMKATQRGLVEKKGNLNNTVYRRKK